MANVVLAVCGVAFLAMLAWHAGWEGEGRVGGDPDSEHDLGRRVPRQPFNWRRNWRFVALVAVLGGLFALIVAVGP